MCTVEGPVAMLHNFNVTKIMLYLAGYEICRSEVHLGH